MAKAPPPNYTQSPNVYFDKWLREINSLAELKVVTAIIRSTFGWHEKETTLTFSELQTVTGLSRGGLNKGLQLAIEHGYIERTDGSRGRICTYRVAIQTSTQNRLVPSADETSLQSELVGPQTSLRRRPELVHEIDRQPVYGVDRPIDKEKEKESRKKEDPRGYPFDYFAVVQYETYHKTEIPIFSAETIVEAVEDTEIDRTLWGDVLQEFKGNGYQPNRVGNAVNRFVRLKRDIAAGRRESPIAPNAEKAKTLRERMGVTL